MKRIVCLLIAVLMLFTVCLPTYAADDEKIEVTVGYGNDGLWIENCKPDQIFTFIHAVYAEDGALRSVETQEVDLDGRYFTMVNFTEPYSIRSKIFLWESLESMKPVDFVLNIFGEPQNTAEPTDAPAIAPEPPDMPTAEPTADPTDTPVSSEKPTPTPTPTATPTATPAPVVTSAPTPSPTPSSTYGGREKHLCTVCRGNGKCQKCNGTGYIQRYAAGGGTIKSRCTQCSGSGKCYFCGGTGWGYY